MWLDARTFTRDDGALDVWLITLDPSPTPGDADLLSDQEKDRARRFASAEVSARFVSARAALRRLLARYTGRRADAGPGGLEIRIGPAGKPALDPGLGLELSLAHA